MQPVNKTRSLTMNLTGLQWHFQNVNVGHEKGDFSQTYMLIPSGLPDLGVLIMLTKMTVCFV